MPLVADWLHLLSTSSLISSLNLHCSFTTLPSPAPPSRPSHLVRLANGAVRDPANAHYVAHASYVHTPLWAPANENWAPISTSEFRSALEANALEGGFVFPVEEGGNSQGKKASIVLVKQLTVTREDGDDSAADAWQNWLLNDVGVTLGDRTWTYADLCYGKNCSSTAKLQAHPLHPRQETLTLFLRAPTPDTPSLSYLNRLARLPAFTAEGTNTTLRASALNSDTPSWNLLPSIDTGLFSALGEAKAAAEVEPNPAVRKVRWFAYAARLLIVRFYTLAKVSTAETQVLTLECRLCRHLRCASRLYPHARVFRASVCQHAQTRIQLLAR